MFCKVFSVLSFFSTLLHTALRRDFISFILSVNSSGDGERDLISMKCGRFLFILVGLGVKYLCDVDASSLSFSESRSSSLLRCERNPSSRYPFGLFLASSGNPKESSLLISATSASAVLPSSSNRSGEGCQV